MGTEAGTHQVIRLVNEHGRDIVPEHTRLALSGDVFLAWGVEELPPQGAPAMLCVRGTIAHGLAVKGIPDGEDSKVWAVVAKFKAEDRLEFKLLALPAEQPILAEDQG